MQKSDSQSNDRAAIGDELAVDAPHMGELGRTGEIVEVLDRGDVLHYRVRWDDGHESVYFPGSDSHVIHLHHEPS
jgi:hypothetical protein